jgi:hypothetical protein
MDSEYTFDAGEGDIIRIDEVRRALVLLLDEQNYAAFVHGRRFDGMGGFYRRSPIFFEVPRPGEWHVVIDCGGIASQAPTASCVSKSF